MKISKNIICEANRLARKAGYLTAHSIIFSKDVSSPQVIHGMTTNFDYSKSEKSKNYKPNHCVVLFPENYKNKD